MNSSDTLKCEKLKKKIINDYVDEDIKNTLTKNYRVLPLFEKSLADHSFKRSKSFLNDNIMECRWEEYKNKAATMIRVPFQFPQPSDYHFHNNKMCYKPSESIQNRIDNRYHLVPGPGVDVYGEIPIPSNPDDKNLVKAEKGKQMKYLELAHEIVDMWDVDSAIVPIVVTANGLMAKSLDQHLKRFSLDGWINDVNKY